MRIKFLAALTVIALMTAASASAGIFTFSSGTLNTTIPDGNPVGIASTINVSGVGNIFSSGDNVSMTLNISGGNNGDLYAYLSYDGQIVTLLNRPGMSPGNPVGFTGAGFSVTLSDGSYGNINTSAETSGAQVTGTFNAAGPGNVAAGAAGANASVAFQSYNGLNPDGGWVLFVADMSGGDISQSVLNSWSLTFSAVPEPVNVALGAFGLLFVATIVVRRLTEKMAGNRTA